jgi:hypothetical protein
MTSTLTPTCSFCGLRFENRPLLELHLRDDHPQRGTSAGHRAGNPADIPSPRPHSDGPVSVHAQRAATPSAKPDTTSTGRGSRTGQTTGGLHRVIRAFRNANAQLLLAAEVILHPVGRARPRADRAAEPGTRQSGADERADSSA